MARGDKSVLTVKNRIQAGLHRIEFFQGWTDLVGLATEYDQVFVFRLLFHPRLKITAFKKAETPVFVLFSEKEDEPIRRIQLLIDLFAPFLTVTKLAGVRHLNLVACVERQP